MKFDIITRLIPHPTQSVRYGPLQSCAFQQDFVSRGPNSKPTIRYKVPQFYDPYGHKPPPSEQVVQLAERITSLLDKEHCQIIPTLVER